MDIQDAISYAKKAHKGQTRKYTNEPYINHPISVSKLVAGVTNNSHTIVAAVLHDTLEDTGIEIDDIREKFGDKVANIVIELTDISKPSDGNRFTRKRIDREHTRAASPEAKTIKLADLIDNSTSIFSNDPAFSKVFAAEMKEMLNILKEGDKSLYNMAERILNDYYGRGRKIIQGNV